MRTSFTWEGETVLAKMRMSISYGHLDSHSTNIELFPNNQELTNLSSNFAMKWVLAEEDTHKGSDPIYHNLRVSELGFKPGHLPNSVFL